MKPAIDAPIDPARGPEPDPAVARLANNTSAALRQLAVLALRRQGSSRVADFLQDPSRSVVRSAARAIHDTLPDDHGSSDNGSSDIRSSDNGSSDIGPWHRLAGFLDSKGTWTTPSSANAS